MERRHPEPVDRQRSAEQPEPRAGGARIDQAGATQTIAGAAVAPTVNGRRIGQSRQRGRRPGAVSRAIASAQAAWELDLLAAIAAPATQPIARSVRATPTGIRHASRCRRGRHAYVNLRSAKRLLTGYERDAASRAETSASRR